MNTNDLRNSADQTIGPMDAGAGSKVSDRAELTRAATATVWRGQKQLRQRMLTANSSGASFRNMTSSASRGAGIARIPQVATRG
jgi:hypothetical protein